MKQVIGNAGVSQQLDGGNVPAEEVEAAKAQLDNRTFKQEFEASFENLTGLVAVSFSDSNISTEAEDISIAHFY